MGRERHGKDLLRERLERDAYKFAQKAPSNRGLSLFNLIFCFAYPVRIPLTKGTMPPARTAIATATIE